MSAHKKCSECDFEACKKVLKLHVEECHSKKPIISLDTPEEIEKWIADRKHNYPTAKNIQRKVNFLCKIYLYIYIYYLIYFISINNLI